MLSRILRPFRTVPGVRQAYYEARSAIQYYRNAQAKRKSIGAGKQVELRQTPLTWDVALPPVETSEDLKVYLEGAGLEVLAGGHTLYLPPQPGLEAILGEAVSFYPEDAGFKILRNFGVPLDTPYMQKAFRKKYFILDKMTGTAYDVFIRSNTFHILGFGPESYDLIMLASETQQFSCLVVEHVTGREPAPEEQEAYIARLRQAADEGLITFAVPEGLNHVDFTLAEMGNLIFDAKRERVLMIDAQSVIPIDQKTLIDTTLRQGSADLEFGQHWQWRKGEYVYQSLPGLHDVSKRDTGYRWTQMMHMLASEGHTLDGRMALDICCNAGMMLAMALTEGAKWGLGWDLPEVVAHSARLQNILGFSRLTFTGAQLGPTYDLTQDIPERFAPHLKGACVFFLAAVRHVGWVTSIGALPWQLLFYEGHESIPAGEDEETLYAMAKEWGAEVKALTTISDGDSHPRILALLVRNP